MSRRGVLKNDPLGLMMAGLNANVNETPQEALSGASEPLQASPLTATTPTPEATPRASKGPKNTTYSISFPMELMAQVDKLCKARGMSRSQFFTESVREYFDHHPWSEQAYEELEQTRTRYFSK